MGSSIILPLFSSFELVDVIEGEVVVVAAGKFSVVFVFTSLKLLSTRGVVSVLREGGPDAGVAYVGDEGHFELELMTVGVMELVTVELSCEFLRVLEATEGVGAVLESAVVVVLEDGDIGFLVGDRDCVCFSQAGGLLAFLTFGFGSKLPDKISDAGCFSDSLVTCSGFAGAVADDSFVCWTSFLWSFIW